MPTFLIIGSYRFYVFSHEPNEPPHIHVDKDGASAKFWLEEVSLSNNIGFTNSNCVVKVYQLITRFIDSDCSKFLTYLDKVGKIWNNRYR